MSLRCLCAPFGAAAERAGDAGGARGGRPGPRSGHRVVSNVRTHRCKAARGFTVWARKRDVSLRPLRAATRSMSRGGALLPAPALNLLDKVAHSSHCHWPCVAPPCPLPRTPSPFNATDHVVSRPRQLGWPPAYRVSQCPLPILTPSVRTTAVPTRCQTMPINPVGIYLASGVVIAGTGYAFKKVRASPDPRRTFRARLHPR